MEQRSKKKSPNTTGTPRKKNAASNSNNTNRKTTNTRSNANSGRTNKSKTTAKNIQSQKVKRSEANTHETAVENSIALNIMPFILIIFAVFLLVSFFANDAESVGAFGFFSRNIFYGLFGFSAILIPFFMVIIAVLLKKDMKSGFFKYRIIFSVVCIILYAAMFHLVSLHIPQGEKIKYSDIAVIFDNGTNSIGGGVFGGYLAETLGKFVGTVGTWIFTLPLAVIFSTFLFGYTPAGVIRAIVKLIEDYRVSKNGYERNIVVKTPNQNNRFRPKTHRYTIASQINMPRRNFQVDVPMDSTKDRKKTKKRKDVYISDNPFANSFTEETGETEQTKPTEQNINMPEIDLQPISYETPLMLPDEELFNFTDINKNTDFESLDLKEIKESKNKAIVESGEIEDIKIIESAPQTRGDEPDIFEKSSVFDENENFPVKKEYKFPPISYLTKDTSVANVDIKEELQGTAQKLIDTLASFGVKTKIYGYSRGPSITRYEISPDSGTKVQSIVTLVNDISLNLAAEVRIEAPIPGKAAIGVEVPNKNPEIVYLRSLLEEPQFINAASKITIALGKDVAGNPIYSDIAKMPHVLIAGATGMGKSVCINSIIASILYKATPDEVKMILIDPKKVELNIYNGIPHLLVPVVSDPKRAAGSLSWAVNEMEHRYMLIEEKSVRDFKAYNESIADDPLSEPLPQIVIIIDELADLMITARADVEQSINRLAAKARAAGMHLIVATQRPSVDVVTGLIKANIPTRIAFTVVSPHDSKTVIDMGGAEKLIGRGDMLYVPTGKKPMRVQGAFVSEKDVLSIVEFWKKQSDGQYDETVLSEIEQEAARCNTKGDKQNRDEETSVDDEFKKDSMLKSAIEIAIDTGRISTSLLQTKLSLGYARAARIINTMEKMNLIGPFEGSKPRKVLITRQEFIEMTMNSGDFG